MLNANDVRDLFLNILGRLPEPGGRVQKALQKHQSRSSLAAELRASAEFQTKIKPRLLDLFRQTDGYQDAYGIPGLSKANARPCRDRCQAIENHLKSVLDCGNPAHLSIMDVGCAQGYNSLYFADRGATVVGIDIVPANVEFCSALTHSLGLNASFRVEEFSDSTVQSIIDRGVNTVFFLSVLHHIVNARGQSWTVSSLRRLLDAKITIFAELALKNENVSFSWKDKIPENEIDLFVGNQAILIDQFPALNGNVIRPLYSIQQPYIDYATPDVTGLLYPKPGADHHRIQGEALTFSQVTNAGVPSRQYMHGPAAFAKIYRLGGIDRRIVASAATLELLLGSRAGEAGLTPKLAGIAAGEGYFALVFEKLTGGDLAAFIKRSRTPERRAAALQIAKKYMRLKELGVHWNDCRHHNMLFDDHNEPYFIDFELAAAVALEDNDRRLRWILWHLCHSKDGGLNPSRSLPTHALPPLPEDAEVTACPEWNAIVELLPSPPAKVCGFEVISN